MARAVVTPIKLGVRNKFSEEITYVAIDATDGLEFVMDESDEKYVVLIQNTDSSNDETVTIKKGNGIQGVADYTAKVGKGETVAISLDSGAYKNVSGDDKGKVVITGTADVEVAVVVLP
jgi:hypothetical protein